MYQNKILTIVLASFIASSAFSNSLVPSKYEFIGDVEIACSTGIEDCPDNAGIELLVLDIDAAENTLATEQSELAIQSGLVSDAQDDLAGAEGDAAVQAAQAALDAAIAQEQVKQDDVNTAQGVLDDLNARATALRESSTLDAVFAYYDSKSLIDDQNLVVDQAVADEQAANNAIPGLQQAVADAEAASDVAAQNLVDAQATLTQVTAEELAKPEPDTAAIELATQAVVQAQLDAAQATVDVGVAETELELGQNAVTASATATAAELEILQSYVDSTRTLGEAAATEMSSTAGYLNAEAVYKDLISNEKDQIAQDAEAAAALALQASQAAGVALITAEDELTQAEANRDAARQALKDVDTSDLDALLAAANALSEANAAVVNANNTLGVANQNVANAALDLADKDSAANDARLEADSKLAEARSAQALSLSEDEFMASGSPAVALKESFVQSEDEGQAIIDAVHANYGNTVTNSEAIESNTAAIDSNAVAIDSNAASITENTTNIDANTANISTNTASIGTNTTNIDANTANISTNTASIGTNTANISTNTAAIETNALGIATNSSSISELERSMAVNVDMLKSGIASSLAIAGLPTLTSEGFSVAVGLGYFEGENAAALGLSHVSDSRVVKLSLGHSNGNTSGSLGAAFKF